MRMPISKLGPDTNPNPATMSFWQVEASPPNAGSEHPSTVRVFARSLRRSRLTSAGFAAVAAQLSSYLTSAKFGGVVARAGNGVVVGLMLTTDGFWVDVLPEDGPTQIAALCTLLQTGANVTAA